MHRAVICFLIGLFILAFATGMDARAENSIVLSVIAVLAIGMPHGALDVALAALHGGNEAVRFRMLFILKYVAMAGATVLIWRAFPAFGLTFFLVISAVHFSGDWEGEFAVLDRIAIGTALLGIPALFHGNEVVALFQWLAPSRDAHSIVEVLKVIAIGAVALSAAALATSAYTRPKAALEAGLVLFLAAVATPLTFFVIYFCGLHSVRHLLESARSLSAPSIGAMAQAGGPYALAAVAGVLCGALFAFNGPLDERLFRSVFIALAALTVPHMLLSHSDTR